MIEQLPRTPISTLRVCGAWSLRVGTHEPDVCQRPRARSEQKCTLPTYFLVCTHDLVYVVRLSRGLGGSRHNRYARCLVMSSRM